MRFFKSVVVIVVVLLSGCFSASAQHFVVKAGFTSSQQDISSFVTETIELKGLNIKNYNSFQVGLGYQTGSIAGFTIQPELVYNKKGSQLSDNVKWELSYLQLPVNIQWGPDLIICRPFLQLTPFVGYCLSNNLKHKQSDIQLDLTVLEKVTEVVNKLEYGLAVGGGLEVMDFLQLAIKYAWNFGEVSSFNDYFENISNIKKDKPRSLEVTLGIMF